MKKRSVNTKKQQLHSDFIADRYRLMAFIRCAVRDYQVAEDIFQEVWLRLDAAIQKGTEIQHCSGFCRGIAKNLILRYFRDQKNSKIAIDERLLDLMATAYEEQDSSRSVWKERERALITCIDKLPEHSKEILRLKYQKGLPIAAISTQLQRSVFSITKLLSRVREKLRKCVMETLQQMEMA